MTQSLQDMTRRVQKALATASDSLSGLLRRGSQKALDALSRSVNFINDNIFSLYSSFGGKKTVRAEPKPAKPSVLRTKSQPKPAQDNLRTRAETEQLLSIAFNSRQIAVSTDQTDDGKVLNVVFDLDTSDRANVFFPLSDDNTADAIMNLKRRADRKVPANIQTAKNGYDTLLTATFVHQDNDNLFSLTFENTNITFGKVLEKMKEKDIEYDAFLHQVKVMYSVKPELAGGCEEHNEMCHKLKFGNKAWNIRSPKSTNNNCAIMCFLKSLKINGNKVRADVVRKDCGIPLKTMIRIDQLHFLSDKFECGHIVYNGDDQYNIISEYKLDRENIVELVLMGEHYMYVYGEPAPQKRCSSCGKTYRRKHTCNEGVASFFQQQIHPQGKKWITNALYKKKDRINPKHIIFFDLECFPHGKGRQHTPYAVGWYNYKFKSTYGEKCFDEFIDEISTVNNRVMCAYNGAKYDFYPLMNALMKRGIKIKNHVVNNGKILMLEFNGNRVFDLCLFTQNSLEKACEDFGCDARKSEFDHSKMKSWEDVETYRDEVEPYLKNDVECLKELFTKFNDLIHSIEGVNITTFVTLSHMAYDLWTNSVPEKTVEVFRDREKYYFSSRSVYGGRCYPLVKETKSIHYDKVMAKEMTYQELYESMEYIFNADATSLYPASMKGIDGCPVRYPTGLSRWSEDPAKDFKDGKIGLYEIRWDCPDKKMVVAVLPQKGGDGMRQTIEGGEGVYTSVDIENAMSCGYTIDFIGKALVWDTSSDTLFDEYISKWFKIKNENSGENGNKSLVVIAKLMMNALYGKMLQGVLTDGQEFCYNIKDVWGFRRKYQIKDWMFFDSEQGRCLRLEGVMYEENEAKNIRKPRQLGAFVLAYSRRIMLKYMKEIDPTLRTHVFTYHDTDSLHISGKAHQLLVEKGYCVPKDKSDLGLLCSDIKKEGLIIHEKNMASKNYCYKYINNEEEIKQVMKCKGIPKEDKLGTGETLYKSEIWENEEPVLLTYTSFKKVKNPNRKQQANGVEPFCITTVEQKRTWCKNEFSRMTYRDGKWYPFGYEFD